MDFPSHTQRKKTRYHLARDPTHDQYYLNDVTNATIDGARDLMESPSAKTGSACWQQTSSECSPKWVGHAVISAILDRSLRLNVDRKLTIIFDLRSKCLLRIWQQHKHFTTPICLSYTSNICTDHSHPLCRCECAIAVWSSRQRSLANFLGLILRLRGSTYFVLACRALRFIYSSRHVALIVCAQWGEVGPHIVTGIPVARQGGKHDGWPDNALCVARNQAVRSGGWFVVGATGTDRCTRTITNALVDRRMLGDRVDVRDNVSSGECLRNILNDRSNL